jgi:hypothetical protein
VGGRQPRRAKVLLLAACLALIGSQWPRADAFSGAEADILVEPEPDEKSAHLATATPEVDFALVLARVIDDVNQDPSELRRAIYELARIKLQREAWRRDPPLDVGEMRRLTKALETAIERVEAFSSQRDDARVLRSLDHLIKDQERAVPHLAADPTLLALENGATDESASQFYNGTVGAPAEPTTVSTEANGGFTGTTRVRLLDPEAAMPAQLAMGVPPRETVRLTDRLLPFWQRRRSLVAQTLVVVAVAVGLMLLISQRTALFQLFERPSVSVTAALPAQTPEHTPTSASVPVAPPPHKEEPAPLLPRVYGIYAISNSELFELEALPGRAPDPRIALSAVITKTGRTILPNGRVSFVAYRRDFAASAPERASVRVIAKIVRAMNFGSVGKAQVSEVDETWIMRNISFPFRVAPVASNPEMLALEPESETTLPAGRYGLVINGIAYDFSVAGEVTDPAQCLERVAAANGTFYSPCGKP